MKKTTHRLFAFFLLSLMITNIVHAQLPYLGEIRLIAGSSVPKGWALCNGQLLPINQNQALFSVLGTTYGGNGSTTFALPDLRGRVAIHAGNGLGLTPIVLGEMAGIETATLTSANLPIHTHLASVSVEVSNQPGNKSDPANSILANTGSFDKEYSNGATTGELKSQNIILGNTGGSQAINKRQPYITVNYCIALEGKFPSQN